MSQYTDPADQQEQVLKEWNLDEWLADRKSKVVQQKSEIEVARDKLRKFELLCKTIMDYFDAEWENEQNEKADNSSRLLEIQKGAIIGYASDVNYFKDKINEYLKLNNLMNEWHPSWYNNLVDAIFHENWGVAGVANWLNMPECSSAKIIGDRIFYLINGKEELQTQKISRERFEKLKRALLLKTPKARFNEDYYEVYLLSGERIAIYDGDMVVDKQGIMVFRKYIVERLTFEEQARRGTIPREIIPLLEAMVDIGYNVFFSGGVRTGKTTMLETWQSYEDQTLEGVAVQTDPEILFHKLMPEAPIMQLLDNDENPQTLPKRLRRSDADYVLVCEARDGHAYNLAIEAANMGSIRCKTTGHITFVEDICYDIANKVMNVVGGNLNYHIAKVAKSFHYIIHMVQLRDKSKKRLEGIYELRFNRQTCEIALHAICKYDYLTDGWTFQYD
ncbi:MAG: ATPase, partial [Clostridia bacterium]|nr:ATPase [Clostridia bacterium]